MRRSLLFLLALSVPAMTRASSPFPGGVLDSTGRTAYLSTAESITAVDLSTGQVRWRSDEATEPLFVITDRLYALAATKAGRLFVRGLNLDDRGSRVFESAPIELPRWAVPENAAGRSFSYRWRRDKCQLDITWQVAAWAEGSPRKQASGVATVDLRTGKVQQREGTGLSAEPLPAILERLSVRWHSVTKGQVSAIVLEEQPGSNERQRRHRLIYRRWDEKGRETSSRELLRGREPIVLPDVAGGRLWVRDGSRPPGGEEGEEPRWLVVDASNGAEIARVAVVPGTMAATLHGNQAYFLVPSGVRLGLDGVARRGRALVAVDQKTGKIDWRCSFTP